MGEVKNTKQTKNHEIVQHKEKNKKKTINRNTKCNMRKKKYNRKDIDVRMIERATNNPVKKEITDEKKANKRGEINTNLANTHAKRGKPSKKIKKINKENELI